MILEFTTEAEAETCLATINSMAATWWASEGFTVVDNNGSKELVGKKSGVDAPDSTRTITWDTVKESPDGTWYFASLTGTRFAAGMEQLEPTFTYVEKDFPSEWIEESVIV